MYPFPVLAAAAPISRSYVNEPDCRSETSDILSPVEIYRYMVWGEDTREELCTKYNLMLHCCGTIL